MVGCIDQYPEEPVRVLKARNWVFVRPSCSAENRVVVLGKSVVELYNGN